MSFDAQSSKFILAVIGSGAMGRGIAQIAAQAGVQGSLFDIAKGAAAKAREAVGATFERLRAKGKLSQPAAHRAWRPGVCLFPR
ncbi:3-hydroxyacyl-CoA dehydrogenase NAD-binding domain-containing protein [Polaromonas sp. P2-4]|nr:3-hydroxyacyl-CoA dehydrogenase NAD-binding domain-containing protein [Polaromonas sp. P2-4]